MIKLLKFPKKGPIELTDDQLESILGEMEAKHEKPMAGNRTLKEQVINFYKLRKPKHKERKVEFSHYAGFVLSVADKMSGWILLRGPFSSNVAATLLHLRISIARLALLDEEFLYDDRHPARVLLDKMASAFIGSDGIEGDEVFRELQAIILSMNNLVDHTQTVALQIEQVIEKEAHRTQLASFRIANTIRAKVKMDEAQDTAERAINELLEIYTIPEPMTRLLKLWKNYLVKEHVNNQVSRAEWISEVDQLADILALFQRTCEKQKTIGASKNSQLIDWPRVYQQKSDIANVMEIVGYPENGREPLLSAFEAIYRQFEKGARVVMLKVSVKEKFHCAPDFDTGFATPYELEKALQLKEGTWVEFECGTEQAYKAQLIAKIPEASSMVFMRRNGPKVFEKNYSDIAISLENNLCRVISTAEIYTKAINASVVAVGGRCSRINGEQLIQQRG